MSDGANKECYLCGLDCGPYPITQHFEEQDQCFCCIGCANVYSILLESGAVSRGVDLKDTELFQKSLQLGLISRPGMTEEALEERAEPEIPPGTPVSEILLQVTGMWCSSCSWLIEHVLARVKGVESAQVFFASDLVKVRYYPQYLPPHRISELIEELGYRTSEYQGETTHSDAERKDMLLRLGVAAFFWINLMVLNVGIYARYIQEIPEVIGRLIPLLLMVLATPPVFYSAKPIIRLAWLGLRQGVVRMETLLALGILSAYGYSAEQALSGGEHVYFDTVCALVTLVLVGKWFERSAKEKTSRGITMMYRMMPRKARVLVSGRERFVALEALQPGELFLVKVGERIPADGVVVEGESHVDESLLTGESTPVEKRPGSEVASGSVNVGGVLKIQAVRVGENSTLSQILKAVEKAVSSRSSIERTVDRVSRIFVPSVIGVATVTLLVVWLLPGGDFGEAMMRAISVLVIACPCALGIATPLAVTAAVGTASRRGILVTDSRVFETIRQVNTVAFDKTGTVTVGKFELIDIREEDLGLLASIEAYSEHPLGRAVVAAAEVRGVRRSSATEIEIQKGMGLVGKVGTKRVFVGNRKMIASLNHPSPQLEKQAREWEEEGRTVAFYGWNGTVQGILVLGDRIKPGVRELIEHLRSLGTRTLLVSGDSAPATRWVGGQVGIEDIHAEARPDEKAQIVEEYRRNGRVIAMIGDGVNDSPALAAANLGIAVSTGADIAMKAASIVLMKDDLSLILDTIHLARRTQRVIRQNLFWAFLYNSIGIGLATAGILSPILSAGAMVISSLSVIGNSLRLTR
ncbi:MAG: heavy metal translocating P-type ATPase [Acidobacteriota bacterium]|nr:MAG: heavy metal translocating P-type ATPase [Acidobacteriota bacterium]